MRGVRRGECRGSEKKGEERCVNGAETEAVRVRSRDRSSA